MIKWREIHFGKLKRKDISRCVADPEWQEVRASLHYKSYGERFRVLKNYLEKEEYSFCSKVQVTNYVNALKRTGFIRFPTEDVVE